MFLCEWDMHSNSYIAVVFWTQIRNGKKEAKQTPLKLEIRVYVEAKP